MNKEYYIKLQAKIDDSAQTASELNKQIKILENKISALEIKVKMPSSTSKGFGDLNAQLDKLQVNMSEFKDNILSTSSTFDTTTTRYTNNAGKILTVQEKLIDGEKKYKTTLKEVGSAVETNAKQADTWKYSWSKAFQSFTTYMSVTTVFYQIVRTTKEMINEVTELDSALVELQKVTSLEGSALDSFTQSAYDAAEAVAKTGTEMVQAATEFAKAGYDEKQILQLGELALMYTNIADEEVSAAESAEFMIAQMKAFNIEAEDAIHIIDAVNEVSNKYAVSSADIANNLGKSSAVMANAGNSYEQMIGLLTAGTEITRNASKVSNGLKTITLRMQGMDDEGETNLELVAQMEALYKKLGISVYDSNGELKNTFELLETLAPIYQEATAAEKAYITETIAGKYQAQNAAAILNNFETALSATETALNSEGSAASENAKVLDSIEGKIKSFQSAFEELSQSLISSDFIKGVVDFGTLLLEVANSGFGQAAIKAAALFVVLKGGYNIVDGLIGHFKNFKLVNSDLVKSIIYLTQGESGLGKFLYNNMEGYKSMTAAQKQSTIADYAKVASSTAVNAALGLVSAAIAIGITLWQNHKREIEENAEASRQAAEEMADSAYSSYKETSDALNNYIDKIKSAKEDLEKYEEGTQQYIDAQTTLKDTQDELIESYPDWKDQIENTNDKLEDQLLLLQQINTEEAKKAESNLRDNKNQIEERFDVGDWKGEDARRYGFTLSDIFDEDEIDKITKKMTEFGGVVYDAMDELGGDKSFAFYGDNIMDVYNAYEDFYNYINEHGEDELGLTEKEIESLKDKVSSVKSAINADYDYEDGIEGLKQYGEAALAASDDYKEFIEMITEKGNKGLLDADYINSLLKGDNFSDGDGADGWSPKFEEISKWLNILGYDAEDFVEKYNQADNKMKSFMSDVDTTRLQEYQNAIAANAQQWEDYDNKISTVMNDYNAFWEDLQNLDVKDADTVSQLLEKYPELQKVLEENGKTIDDVVNSLDDYSYAASNFYDINDVMDKDEEKINSLDEINEKYKDVIDTLEEYGYSLSDIEDYENSAIRIFDELNESLGYTPLTTDEITTAIDNLNSDIDSLTNSYSSLTSAINEYNENGYLTMDTLNTLLNLEDGWLNALSLENGQMTLNSSAMKEIVNARLSEAEALAVQTAYSELQTIAEGGEAAAVEYLKGKYGELKGQLDNVAIGYGDVAAAAAQYKAIEGISDSEVQAIDDVMDSLDKRLSLISNFRTTLNQSVSNAMGTSSKASSSSSSSSSKSEKEWWETELDNLKDQFKYNEITIEEYINGLDGLLSKVQKGTDAWRQINEELQKQRLTKVEDDYKRGTISLDEYIKKLKELIKAYKQGSDAWNDLADKIKDALQDKADAQKDDLETAEDAAIGLIDEEIEKLESLKEEQEEYYDKLIADKEKANEETEKELELARLQEALANAQKEKTKRVWREGIGWVWEADQEAIEEAQEALDEFNNEQEIDALEQQKEEAIDAIEEQIDAWEKYKESWEDVADDYETQQARITLAQQLGADAEAKILQQRLDVLEDYKNKYLATMKEIEDLENTPADKLNGYETPADTNVGISGGSSSSSSSAPSLSKGSYVSVKPGTKWYANSYGGGSSGTARSGTIKYVNSGGSHPYNIDGLGWVKKSDIVGYANGGMVDYTGLAMLHGTKSKPEFVLNNDQMKNLLGTLTRPQTVNNMPNNSSNVSNYNFGNIELPNVTNAKQFITELKSLVNITKHQ